MKTYEPQYKKICENLSKLQNHEGELVFFISYSCLTTKYLSKMYFFFIDPQQLWKFDGGRDFKILKNKEDIWIPKNKWKILQRKKWIHIQNSKTNKVLGTTHDGKVIEEDLVDNKPGQLWMKGRPNSEGYFILENSHSLKVMTAISESNLEIRGMYL